MKLVLASASPRRIALLRQIGVEPSVVLSPDIDETPKVKESPRALALRLAGEKARVFAAEDRIVLAADTVVAVGRRILPKTETESEAQTCLGLMSGRTHRVLTGVAICVGAEPARARLGDAKVRFARLSKADFDSYIASGEWRGKAGGYAIQGRAERFALSIAGSYSAIVGLPLYETAHLLRAAGFVLP